jgi:exopolysaccharide production protein ExoY
MSEIREFVSRIEFDGKSWNLYCGYLKRPLDVLLASFLVAICLPLLIIVSLAVKTDGGPIFYTQERVGRNNRRFRIWKFRSMVVDAEERMRHHLTSDSCAREEWDVHQKLKRDPRVTAVGGLIRRTSLDELPQLWNILKGDMSFVGPRPIMPSQIELFPNAHQMPVRPGLTGLWQVSARHESTFEERSVWDEHYMRNLSFATDATIVLRTFSVVLRGTGV